MPPDIRAALAKLMTATLADAANWTYAEVRPLEVPPSWKKGQKVTADCSKASQYLAKWAGAPDPMDNGFGPYGNSQTIWLALHHVDTAAALEVGDPVTFGQDGDQHAAMVMTPGADPLLWSFGHQGAPNTYRLSQDGRPAQFCKLPIIAPPPTPQDKLRAASGWFAWMKWALGEGEWKRYGKSNRSVRPAVPRVIPLSWWKRRAAFLLRRKRGNRPTTK